ncbi:MAG TPA: heavy metal sensor histidine kinase [Candidatus Acidoferrales bacterium]|jgi:heavy metal sensor kinase|nr:heavy metal sensor histidine kinase [Candidatus Acidoferrales bacterium]
MISLGTKSVRTRLTLWYVLVLTSVIIVYVAGASLVLVWQMRSQIDRQVVQDLETVEGLLYFTEDGRLHFNEDYHNHPESKLVQERMLEVLSPDGTILFKNNQLGERVLGGAPFMGEGVGGYSQRSERLPDGTRVILASRAHTMQDRPILLRVAFSEEPIWSRLQQMLAILLLALPLALAAAAYAGYKLAGRVLDPIEKMAQRAQQITSERLGERLPIENAEDELGHLARTFNEMLSRIEESFEQLKRFTSDASHELRTPLAAIRSIGEVGLHKNTSGEEYRDIIGSMLEEVNRLTNLVESLLTLSRADAGELRLRYEIFPVIDLLSDAASLLEVLIEEKKLTFTLTGDESLYVKADRLFLRQAVINVLHNAVKFTPSGGAVALSVARNKDGKAELSITDNGPGIPAEHRTLVFDRFYRVDPARSGENKGAGLGLSIARWAVQSHDGEIALSNVPDGGCTFSIRLPTVPQTSAD